MIDDKRKAYEKVLFGDLWFFDSWRRQRAAEQLAKDDSLEAVRLLARVATKINDDSVRSVALRGLAEVTRQEKIDAICRHWSKTRDRSLARLIKEHKWEATQPFELRVLTALKSAQLEASSVARRPEMAKVLVDALEDSDRDIREQALHCLAHLDDKRSRTAVAEVICPRWHESRSRRLEQAVSEGEYLVYEPVEVSVAVGLKVNRTDLLRGTDRERTGPELEKPDLIDGRAERVANQLREACEDSDGTIAKRARQALETLAKPEAQEVVCQLALNGDEIARKAALKGGYLPQDERDEALFYLLTEQWDEYDAFDFEREHLQLAYDAASEEKRRHIRKKIRVSGRPEFLDALTRGNTAERLASAGREEVKFVAKQMVEQRRENRLWEIAKKTSPLSCIQMVNVLRSTFWEPEKKRELALFALIADLAEMLSSYVPDSAIIINRPPEMVVPFVPTGHPKGCSLIMRADEKTVLSSIPDLTSIAEIPEDYSVLMHLQSINGSVYEFFYSIDDFRDDGDSEVSMAVINVTEGRLIAKSKLGHSAYQLWLPHRFGTELDEGHNYFAFFPKIGVFIYIIEDIIEQESGRNTHYLNLNHLVVANISSFEVIDAIQVKSEITSHKSSTSYAMKHGPYLPPLDNYFVTKRGEIIVDVSIVTKNDYKLNVESKLFEWNTETTKWQETEKESLEIEERSKHMKRVEHVNKKESKKYFFGNTNGEGLRLNTSLPNSLKKRPLSGINPSEISVLRDLHEHRMNLMWEEEDRGFVELIHNLVRHERQFNIQVQQDEPEKTPSQHDIEIDAS